MNPAAPRKTRLLQTLPMLALLAAMQVHATPMQTLLKDILSNHPDMQLAEAQEESAKGDVKAARSGYMPTLGLQAGIGENNALAEERQITNAPVAVAALPLYDFGKTGASVRFARESLDAATLKRDVVREQLAAQLAELYSNALRERNAWRILEKESAAFAVMVGKIEQISKIDSGRRFEFVQVTSRYQGILQQAQARKTQYMILLGRLRAFTDNANLELDEELPLPQHPLLSLSESELVALLPQTPRLEYADQALQASRAELARQRHDNNPTLKLTAQYGPERAFAGTYGFGDSSKPALAVGINVNMPLYDGGLNRGRVAVAKGRVAQSDAQQAGTLRELEADVRAMRQSINERPARIETLGRQAAAALEMRDAAFDQFLVGRRSLTDLLTFEADVYQALLAQSDESVELRLSTYRLLGDGGVLAQALMDTPLAVTP